MWKPIILDVECIVCNKSLQKINHDPQEATRKMGKIAYRRSRTPNWSVDEKQYLLELIRERKDIVVTKTTNGPNHYEEKEVAWREILAELTTRFGNKFCGSSIKKVKTQWQNMKRIAREEITLNGMETGKYSRQSLEVCNILELIKDGVLVSQNETVALNDTTITAANIEIKTERIDEDLNQPGGSGSSSMDMDQPLSTLCQRRNDTSTQLDETQHTMDSSASSVDEQVSEMNEYDPQEDQPVHASNSKRTVSANTEESYLEEFNHVNPLNRNLQEFYSYSSTEKELKLESLREERQVLRAMRETAELNKIIAEQKLKHLLWTKKQEMA